MAEVKPYPCSCACRSLAALPCRGETWTLVSTTLLRRGALLDAGECGRMRMNADRWTQVVYEFLVRFVVSSEVDAKQAKQYVDQALCLQLVDLFDRCVCTVDSPVGIEAVSGPGPLLYACRRRVRSSCVIHTLRGKVGAEVGVDFVFSPLSPV